MCPISGYRKACCVPVVAWCSLVGWQEGIADEVHSIALTSGVHHEVRSRIIDERDGIAAGHRVDHTQTPSADNGIERSREIGSESSIATDRNFPNGTRDVKVRYIGCGDGLFGCSIQVVDPGALVRYDGTYSNVFQLSWSQVNCFGPCKGVQQGKSVGKAALQFRLQSVIAAVVFVMCDLDVAEFFDRPSIIQGDSRRRQLREQQQESAMLPDVVCS